MGERTDTKITTPSPKNIGDNAVIIVGSREGIIKAVALIKELVAREREQQLRNEVSSYGLTFTGLPLVLTL